MNKIYQKSFPDVKNAFRRVYGAIEDKFSVPAAKVISQVTVHMISGTTANVLPKISAKVLPVPTTHVIAEVTGKVIPECLCRESQPCKTAKRLGLPNPAGRQTRGHDGGRMKRAYAAGFTLIELLVVVLIIGVLAAAALPVYEKAVWKSRARAAWIKMMALKKAEEVFYIENGYYTNDFSQLSIDVDGGWTCAKGRSYCQITLAQGFGFEVGFDGEQARQFYGTCIATRSAIHGAICQEYTAARPDNRNYYGLWYCGSGTCLNYYQ